MNAPGTSNNTSTTSGITTRGLVDTALVCNVNSNGSSSKNSKSSHGLLSNSPANLRNELLGNCSSLLNDDDLDHECGIIKSLNSNHTIGKSAKLQSAQFNRYLISSPLISDNQENFENCRDDDDDDDDNRSDEAEIKVSNSKSNSNASTSTLSKTMHLPPMMMMRSHNFTNGNFNAKISTSSANKTIVSTPSLNESQIDAQPTRFNPNGTIQKHQFSNFTLNRHFELAKNQVIDKDYYENTNFNDSSEGEAAQKSDDLNRLFQDTNYKLSDLFNELSPSLILSNNNSSNNNTPYSTPINSNQYQSTQLYTTKLNSTPAATSSNSNQNANVFQQFPTFTSSPSSIQLQSASSQMNTPTPPARQLLLQTTNTNPNAITNSSFVNRFPNPPFSQNGSATISSTTTKFYNNFYRNPIKTTTDQCKHLNI